MQRAALLAVAVSRQAAGGRFLETPGRCQADFPVARDASERSSWSFLLNKYMPQVVHGQQVEARSVRDHAEQHGPLGMKGCSEESYGEITPGGAAQLFGLVNLTAEDAFFDIGSGVGKLPVEAVVVGGAKSARGVELSKGRHELACEGLKRAQKELQEEAAFAGNEGRRVARVELIRGDMLGQDFSGATVVYTASICFRAPLLAKLEEKLARELPPRARVATLQDFRHNSTLSERLVQQQKSTVEVSWTPQYSIQILRAK